MSLPPAARLVPITKGAWRRRMDPVSWPPAGARSTAGADGRFRLERLARGRYVVLATADDGMQAWVGTLVAGTGDTVEIELEVPPSGGPLHGRVRHADGRPWRGFVRRVGLDAQEYQVLLKPLDFGFHLNEGLPRPLDLVVALCSLPAE